jgi:hypothetical protein
LFGVLVATEKRKRKGNIKRKRRHVIVGRRLDRERKRSWIRFRRIKIMKYRRKK